MVVLYCKQYYLEVHYNEVELYDEFKCQSVFFFKVCFVCLY